MMKRFLGVIIVSAACSFSTLSSANCVLDFIHQYCPNPLTASRSAPMPAPAQQVAQTQASQPVQAAVQVRAQSMNSVAPARSNNSFNIDSEAQLLSTKAQNLNPQVIKLGLKAYLKAREEGLDPQQVLTIVDYSQPSTQQRLSVFDLKTNNLLFHELVAHGKNSGENLPTSFSDAPSSLKSSLGVFLTQNTYSGHHGYSLRLDGLEKGFNDMAAAREIVVHAANYVSEDFARAHGRLGKSWGCFAVNPGVSEALIHTIKDGTLLFAYYPDKHYLSNSTYVS